MHSGKPLSGTGYGTGNENAYEKETKPLAKQILGQLLENLDIAGKDMIPICQDTGMAVVFLKSDRMYILKVEAWKMQSMKECDRVIQKDI